MLLHQLSDGSNASHALGVELRAAIVEGHLQNVPRRFAHLQRS
jgi:hypothetical protein